MKREILDSLFRWRKKNPSKWSFIQLKSRAKKAGIPFDITEDDIPIPDTCPVFGIPLIRGKAGRGRNNPSVDRIDPAKGYIKGNVRVICQRANAVKSNSSLEELELVVKDLKKLRENIL